MYLNNMTNMQKNKLLSFLWGIQSVNIFQSFQFKFWNINYLYANFGFCLIILLYLTQFSLIFMLDIDSLQTTTLKIIMFFVTIIPTIIVLILNLIAIKKLENYIKWFEHHLKKENI